MNAMAVKVLKLRTLNNERLMHLVQAWLHKLETGVSAPDDMTPSAIATKERLLPWLKSERWSTPRVGVELQHLIDDSSCLGKLLQSHEDDAYVLGGSVRSL